MIVLWYFSLRSFKFFRLRFAAVLAIVMSFVLHALVPFVYFLAI